MLFENIFWGIITGVVTCMLALFFRPLANKYGLTDMPGGRKRHTDNVPLIGGICIYAALVGGFLTANAVESEIKWLLICVGFLLLTGIIDDFFDIRPIYKLLAQTGTAIAFIYGSGIYINIIAWSADGTPLKLGTFGYVLTVIAFVGIVNAFNMMDGIDGLAGSITILVTLGVFWVIALLGREIIHLQELYVFQSAVFGYLLINMAIISRRKIFLGDAGSMMVGFVVAAIVIYYSQLPPEKAIPPSMAVWLNALPVIDTIIIMVRRIGKGQSPFRADRNHLHHLCQRFRFGSGQTLAIMCLLSFILSLIGFCSYLLLGDIGSYIIFVLLLVGYYFFIRNIWRISSRLRKLGMGKRNNIRPY